MIGVLTQKKSICEPQPAHRRCGLRRDLSRTLCTKSAGVTIGIPWNGLSVRRSASPETIKSAWPLTASSRNLSSFGSRQAVIRSVVVDQLGRRKQFMQPISKARRDQRRETRAG